MKIKEEIKTSGDFWLPTIPDRKVPGTLSISPEGDIELEILKPLESNIEAFSRNMGGFNRLVGNVQKYGSVTLDGCQYKTKTHRLSVGQDLLNAHSVLWVNRVFTGVKYHENEIPRFNTFTFSIEGIDEWVGMDLINYNYEPKEQIKIVAFKPIQSILFNLVNGMQLEIVWSVIHNSSLSPREEKITQETSFKLVSKNNRELNELISVAQKLTDLLRLATNETVSLDSMSATSDNFVQDIEEDETTPIPINIYSRGGIYPKNVPHIDRFHMLFGFSDIQNDAEGMINKWIDIYGAYEDALILYFSAQSTRERDLRSKFLSLAQGLEVYHRKAYGEEPDENTVGEVERQELIACLIEHCPEEKHDWLRRRLEYPDDVNLLKRIKELINPFFKEIIGIKRSKLARKISVTRNYLTHYNPDLESEAAKGTDLYVLCLKMELLFELHFLKLTGFAPEKIQSIANTCPKLKWKRSLSLSEQ